VKNRKSNLKKLKIGHLERAVGDEISPKE